MKSDPEPVAPLICGICFALALHVGAAAAYVSIRDTEGAVTPPEPKIEETVVVEDDPAPPAQTASAPDYVVRSIDVAAPRHAGEPVALTVRVANAGADYPADTFMLVTLDGEPLATPRLAPIRSGKAIRWTQTIIVHEPGRHEITVMADPEDRVAESDETNNELKREFSWATGPQIGQLDPSPLNINWISVADYRKLLARRRPFDQAAVQAQVDPTPNVETPLDPTPPIPAPSRAEPAAAPVAVAQAEPTSPESPSSTETPIDQAEENELSETPKKRADQVATSPSDDSPAEPEAAPESLDDAAPGPQEVDSAPPLPENSDPPAALPSPSDVVDSAVAERRSPESQIDPIEEPGEQIAESPTEEPEQVVVATLPLAKRVDDLLSQPKRPVEPQPERPRPSPSQPKQSPAPDSREPVPPKPDVTSREPRPTAAPKDEREASPVTRIDFGPVRPGEVLARHGVKVNTARPNFPTTAIFTFPRNPDVEIDFDKKGKVLDVRFVTATGYPNVDAPLRHSLYRWTAEGEPIGRLGDQTMTVKVRILLGRDD